MSNFRVNEPFKIRESKSSYEEFKKEDKLGMQEKAEDFVENFTKNGSIRDGVVEKALGVGA